MAEQEQKWTPGAWSLAKPDCPAMTTTLYGPSPDKRLGVIHTGSSEYIANAHLIAAAPELYEALGILLDLATSSYCEFCQKHAPKDEHGQIVGEIVHAEDCPYLNAAEALAKARGETP